MSTLESEIREITDRIARLIHEAYQRGEADALERVVRLARSNPSQTVEPLIQVTPRAEDAPHEDRKRAPKGTVGELVDRALNNGSGKTPDEIKAHAVSDYERMVARASIRSHLRIGASKGRYRQQGRRWYAIHGHSAESAGREESDNDTELWLRQGESR